MFAAQFAICLRTTVTLKEQHYNVHFKVNARKSVTVTRVNHFKQSSEHHGDLVSRVGQQSSCPTRQAIFSPFQLLGSRIVLPCLKLCSSDPETHNSNCSSRPLGLPSQSYDLFQSDHSARLIRTPKRRGQSPQAKKFSPETSATNTTSDTLQL